MIYIPLPDRVLSSLLFYRQEMDAKGRVVGFVEIVQAISSMSTALETSLRLKSIPKGACCRYRENEDESLVFQRNVH